MSGWRLLWFSGFLAAAFLSFGFSAGIRHERAHAKVVAIAKIDGLPDGYFLCTSGDNVKVLVRKKEGKP